MSTKSNTKRVKSKITKLIEKSDSENEENTHELSFYVDDRVKLMKEVLKIIKPKKIKAMAPECIKDLDIEEINSMLLEELLGISNKRLKYIFNGQNPAEDSSSTDSEEEKQPIDIISLDDVSDDDFVIDVDSDKPIRKKKKSSSNSVPKPKKIKKEKHDKKKNSEKLQEENLMSVLELLELQARARAIRSQLMIEGSKKKSEEAAQEVKSEDDSDEEAVIIQSPKNEEIIITSSESESEEKKQEPTSREDLLISTNGEQHKKKIKLNRQKFNERKRTSEDSLTTPNDDIPAIIETVREITENSIAISKPPSTVEEGEVVDEPTCSKNTETVPEKPVIDTSEVTTETVKKPEEKTKPEEDDDDDGVILIVDQDEIDGIIGID